jgi:hypothetical protein
MPIYRGTEVDSVVGALIGAAATIGAVLLAHSLSRGWTPDLPRLGGRNRFRRVVVHLVLSRWRPRGSLAGPFEEGRCVATAGLQEDVDVWDESLVLAEWTPATRIDAGWTNSAASSGLVTFSPVVPADLELDENRYRTSNGQSVRFSTRSVIREPILYSTHRINGFQAGQQDFSFVCGAHPVDLVSLSLDLSGALADAAYVHNPEARVIPRGRSAPTGDPLPMRTWRGRTWHLDYRPDRSDDRIRLTWELVETMPSSGRLFVFGYGSLLSAVSRAKTLPDHRAGAALPAVARGFRKTWTACGLNRAGYANAGMNAPAFLASLNLERDPEAVVHGVLVELSRQDVLRLDRREALYVRFDITSSVDLLDGGQLPDGARVIVYLALGDPSSGSRPDDVAIRQDYVDLMLAAGRELDLANPSAMGSFASEIEQSVERFRVARSFLSHQATPDSRYLEDSVGQQ